MLQVLVIEDHPELRRAIATLLRRQAHSIDVVQAASMSEAASCAASRAPDFVVSDLCLPDSRGIRTFHSLLELAPRANVAIYSSLWELSDQVAEKGGRFFAKPDGIDGVLTWLADLSAAVLVRH